MLIKKAKYKKVKVWQQQVVTNDVFGCDSCKCKIKEFPNEDSRLLLHVYHSNGETECLHFCSWECVFDYLPSLQTDYFVELPILYFTNVKNKGRNVNTFMNILKRLKQK